MSAETKPPFDPEAEGRRLALKIGDDRGSLDAQIRHASAALRRAYDAGAADMRERAAAHFEGAATADAPATAQPWSVAASRGLLREVAATVRALPLSETR